MSEPTPVPIQKLGQGCAVESLHGVLRVKEPGAPLTVFAIVRLSDEDLDAIHGKEKADAIRADAEARKATENAPFDLVGYVNSSRLWPRLRERGGQTLVDEVRGALGLATEAVSRARSAKEAEESAKQPRSHWWAPDQTQPNGQFCRACGAHEDGKPCRPFAPGDLEGMCQHDAYRNEACAECGRDAEKVPRTKEDVRKLVDDHNAAHPGKSKVIFNEAAFDDLVSFEGADAGGTIYDATKQAIDLEVLVFSGVPFDEAVKRLHGASVQTPPPPTEEKP